MRRLVLVILAFVAIPSFASTITLRKMGSCSGKMRIEERATHKVIASCGIGCDQRAVAVPAGTWVRVVAVPLTRCAGSLRDEFQVEEKDLVVAAKFSWVTSTWTTFGSSVK